MKRLSKYVRVVPYEEGTILFNTINTCIVELPEGYISDRNILSNKLDYEEISYLESNDFFIEDKDALKRFEKDVPENVLNIILSLTENCNLHCQYCYENDLNTRKVMNKEIVDKVIQYIENVLASDSCIKKIHFDLIGGEPLLAIDMIEYLITEMKKFEGIPIHYLLESNGVLFNQRVRDIFSDVNMTAHISLSMEKDHNTLRPLRERRESYQIILDNLMESSDFFNKKNHVLTIRYNVHQDNIEDYDDFAKLMHETLNYPFEIETAMIVDYEYNDFQARLSLDKYAKWNIKKYFKDAINPFDDDVFWLKPKKCRPCLGYEKNSIKVHADGTLGLCNAWMSDNRRGTIDDLLNGIRKEDIFPQISQLNGFDKECQNCGELFLCGGKRFCKGDNQCEYVDFDIDDYLIKYVKERRDSDEDY